MTDNTGPSPSNTDRLLGDCVAEALKHEDPERFLAWFRTRLDAYAASEPPDLFREAGDHERLAAIMGRAIWNAMPLPGNGLQPRPLAEPGRNERCFCGSGRKYKRCCARIPDPPQLDSTLLLPLVLRRAPQEILEQALGAGRAPIDSLVELASMHMDEGKPKKAAQVLELLFKGKPRRHDERLEYALDMLCNQYDALGHDRKKRKLLQSIIDHAPRSPLRSGAWQRLAAIRMDDGDDSGAWEAFRRARQDSPDAPSLGLLEVQLLYGEDRLDEARERAAFWERRLRRLGYEDNRLLEFLEGMAADPDAAMAEVGMSASGDTGRPLAEWLAKVGARPAPAYRTVDASTPETPEALHAELAERLRAMGVSADQIDDAVEMLAEQLEQPDGDPAVSPDPVPAQDPDPSDSPSLAPPPEVAAIEAQWREVAPLDKPFSVQADPFESDDPWDADTMAEWMSFLDRNPGAFDSLDILDDLAAVVRRHPRMGLAWVEDLLLEPLLRRAEAIVKQAVSDREEPRLSWLFTENRPALRSLSRLVELHLRRGEDAEAERVAAWVLELNPNDNHGHRGLVANERLARGDDEGLLALADRYPDDPHPETAFGRVLALYRLGRLDDAQQALCEAARRLPRIPRALTAKRLTQPALQPGQVTLGGADQAWLYRYEMRETWAQTPGALDWLKQAVKRCS